MVPSREQVTVDAAETREEAGGGKKHQLETMRLIRLPSFLCTQKSFLVVLGVGWGS